MLISHVIAIEGWLIVYMRVIHYFFHCEKIDISSKNQVSVFLEDLNITCLLFSIEKNRKYHYFGSKYYVFLILLSNFYMVNESTDSNTCSLTVSAK